MKIRKSFLLTKDYTIPNVIEDKVRRDLTDRIIEALKKKMDILIFEVANQLVESYKIELVSQELVDGRHLLSIKLDDKELFKSKKS